MANTKVILQSTFDDVVRENMCEFEMEIDEAIEDAIKQFQAQGLNICNVIPDFIKYASGESEADAKHPLLVHLQKLDQFSVLDETCLPESELIESFKIIQEQCNQSPAHRALANQKGALHKLFIIFRQLAQFQTHQNVLLCCLDTLAAFAQGQPDIFEPNNHLAYLISFLQKSSSPPIVTRILKLFRLSCFLHEANKQYLVTTGAIVPLLFTTIQNYRHESDLVKEACLLLRSFTLDDDIRVEFSQAHERAKTIVMEADALHLLLELCKEFNETSDQVVVSEIFHTLGALSVRNEFCQQVLDQGGVKFLIEALQTHYKHANIASSAAALIKSLCGNDNVKVAVLTHNGIPLLLESIQFHINVEAVVGNGSAAIAAACLRTPDAAVAAVHDGNAAQVLVQVLEKYRTNANVFRPACMAIRNIVSRTPEIHQAFLNAGVEKLLNRPGLQLCSDEAKAALRDLGCAVELRELWTGKGKTMQQ